MSRCINTMVCSGPCIQYIWFYSFHGSGLGRLKGYEELLVWTCTVMLRSYTLLFLTAISKKDDHRSQDGSCLLSPLSYCYIHYILANNYQL